MTPPNEPGRKITITVTAETEELLQFSAVRGTWLASIDAAIEILQCKRGEILDSLIGGEP